MFVAQNIDAWIMMAGGILACWYGYRPMPADRKHTEWLVWRDRWGHMLRIVGPPLVIFAVVEVLSRGAFQ